MTDALSHRGPDDAGYWFDADAGIALGHRRLAIIDLSPAGHQPMKSASGRWQMVFNGEIYNHFEIRRELQAAGAAPAWHGHSDTETLLAAVEAWGVEVALRRSEGMFAIALWDRHERALWLARDRFGEKPLYYGWNRGVFLFGSELKALRSFPGFDAPVDRSALALYLRQNAVPAPFSIHTGILKLLPGHWLKLGQHELERAELPEPSAYWSASRSALLGRAQPFTGSEAEATQALEDLLRDAVGRQMQADVPLGAFLSGGIDSSLIVALMQTQSASPVRTFTVGFGESGHNEAHHAAAVADYLGTAHTKLVVTSEDAMAVIPRLPRVYDEPFADCSQIPTLLVAELARKHVTVTLSGDGGDEIFGGYNRYFLAERMWRYLSRMPRQLRHLVGAALVKTPISVLDAGLRTVNVMVGVPPSICGDRIHKAAAMFDSKDESDLWWRLTSFWAPTELMGSKFDSIASLQEESMSFVERMMLTDTTNYMADDILVKVDRAAMACSLETRVPLLDHRIFEFAWRLPMNLKMRGDKGKYLLRQVLYRHVPRPLIDRPKMGFGVPIDSWLRGPLKDWAVDLLDPARLRDQGYFDPQPVIRKWQEHQSGVRNWQYHLWSILMFQAWLDKSSEA